MESVSGKINLAGIACFKRAKISSSKTFFNIKILVAYNLSQFNLILGRDLIEGTPEFQDPMAKVKCTVEKAAVDLKNATSESNSDSHEDENPQVDLIDDHQYGSDLQVRDSLEDHLSYEHEQAKNLKPENPLYDYDHREPEPSADISLPEVNEVMDETRREIERLMATCSAKSPNELDPEQLRAMEFKIELIDPNQRPIRCKARSTPFALKEQVREEIMSQFNSGLIRRSRSEWAAPLHIV